MKKLMDCFRIGAALWANPVKRTADYATRTKAWGADRGFSSLRSHPSCVKSLGEGRELTPL